MNSTDETNTTVCPSPENDSAEESSATSRFALALTRSRGEVDRVLDELPDIRQEARRVITRDLSFSPDHEQLRMIDSMAHGAAGKESVRDSLRSILALRLVAMHALDELLDANEIDAERIRRAGDLMPSLVTAVHHMEEGVRSGVKTLPPADRDCLLQTAHALLPSKEWLVTGAVLAPRLELLALAGKQGELSMAVPRLTEDDLTLVRSTLASVEDDTDGASRVCVNALTLRTIIDDDLASWEVSREVAGGDPRTPGTRDWCQTRLNRDKIAYDFLAEQLQARQDSALVAGLQEFAEELSRVKGELFASYLKLAPALREASRSPNAETADDTPAGLDMERLLEESAQADTLAETKKEVTTDEVYLDALQDLDGSGTGPARVKRVRTRDLRREKKRLRVMIGIVVILATVVVIQYGFLLRGAPEEDLRLDLTDFPGKALLNEAIAVGPMMYASVSHHTWEPLTEPQRVRRVEDLGLHASDQGFEKIWLTDENNRHLATWSESAGVELVQLEAPEETRGKRE